jgi:hypothetical protein
MEYRGLQFEVSKDEETGMARWSVMLSVKSTAQGQEKTKQSAIIAAWRTIDKTIKSGKERH